MPIELLIALVAVSSSAFTAGVMWLHNRRAEQMDRRREALRARLQLTLPYIHDRYREIVQLPPRKQRASLASSDVQGDHLWDFQPLDSKKLKELEHLADLADRALTAINIELTPPLPVGVVIDPRPPIPVSGVKSPPQPRDLPRVAHVVEAIANAILPTRVNDEQLGDAIERRERYRHEGRHPWWVTVWFIAQVGWAFYTAITGKGGAAAKKSPE